MGPNSLQTHALSQKRVLYNNVSPIKNINHENIYKYFL